MSSAKSVPRSACVVCWIARIWSVLVTAGAMLIIFSPDPTGASEPIAPVDWFLLSWVALAFLGLFIAWRWELVGGILTVAALFIREIAWVVFKGSWFAGFLILWLLIAPPAVLFMIAGRLRRSPREP